MMRAALLLLGLFAGLTATAAPQFGSNSIPLHSITKFAPTKIPKVGIDWKMQKYLHYSDKEPLNFADRYTLLEIGCGTGCLEFCLIDRTTGNVYPGMDFTTDFPLDYKGPSGFTYRRSSRLLVVHRADNFECPIFVDYYLWDKLSFRILQTDRIQREANKKVQPTGASRSAQERNRTSLAADHYLKRASKLLASSALIP
jgi:hypothetical protein